MTLWDAIKPAFATAPRPVEKPAEKPPAPPLTEDTDDDEEDEETQAERDDRRFFLVGWFRRTRADVEHRVEQLTGMLAGGEIDSRGWADAFRKELTDAHSEAHSIGRRLAGFLGPFSPEDRAAGEAAWAEQEEYFAGFLADLERGRYTKPDGTLNERAFDARAKQYAAATRGTAHEAFRVALGKDLTDWNLSAAVHCKLSPDFPYNCPDLAAESPKPADEWQTAPGRGKCPCRGNCLCWLSTDKYSTEGL